MLKVLNKDRLKSMLQFNTTPGIRNSESFEDHGEQTIELIESLGEETLLEYLQNFDDLSIRESMSVLREAGISESGFAEFTRAGVEAVVRDGYAIKLDKLPGSKLVMTVQSKRFQENYAWLFNPDMPQPLGDMEEPRETDILPRSLTVTNEDFGISLNLSRRLVDDDQTGEFMDYAGRVGRNHAIQEDIYWAGYLTGAAFSHSGVSVPAPSYSDPDGTTGVYVTSTSSPRCNAITPAALSPSSLQALLDLMDGIEDPNGKLILPTMDTLVVGNGYRWNAAHIIHSTYWAAANPSTATANVTTGGPFGPNPLDPKMGVLNAPIQIAVEPHYNGAISTATSKYRWYLMEKQSRSLCRQERQPLEILMEAPNVGFSLRKRAFYQRTYRRFAYAWFDARYVGQGSDGTV